MGIEKLNSGLSVVSGSVVDAKKHIIVTAHHKSGGWGLLGMLLEKFPEAKKKHRNSYYGSHITVTHESKKLSIIYCHPFNGVMCYETFRRVLGTVLKEAGTEVIEVAAPYGIGCGRLGGGSWRIVQEILAQASKEAGVKIILHRPPRFIDPYWQPVTRPDSGQVVYTPV